MANNNYKYKKDKNGKYRPIHRIVMEEHLGYSLPTNLIIYHKDKNKFNNDIDNLQVLSKKEYTSILHAGSKKTFPKDYIPHNKLSDEIITKIIKLHSVKMCYSKIGKILNISGQTAARYISKNKLKEDFIKN